MCETKLPSRHLAWEWAHHLKRTWAQPWLTFVQGEWNELRQSRNVFMEIANVLIHSSHFAKKRSKCYFGLFFFVQTPRLRCLHVSGIRDCKKLFFFLSQERFHVTPPWWNMSSIFWSFISRISRNAASLLLQYFCAESIFLSMNLRSVQRKT